MVPKSAYPPLHHHDQFTKTIPPTTAQKALAKFLTKSKSQPHLHPDSLLTTSGITFSPSSGPRGGIALHHLSRIEAGLRDENLAVETKEELDALFGDPYATNLGVEGDDSRLDVLIEATEKKTEGGKKRKRKREEIEAWAETSSNAPIYQEIESFANTPLHQPEWEEREEYELAQRPMGGEVGDRDGAPVVQQGGEVPDVVEHDEEGHVKKKKPQDKEAKKAAKKARKDAKKREKIEEVAKAKGKGG